ncbi:MAG: CDP-alcohol phosphatidyltransferase family protein [Candidatus Eisenbacteria bacterium]
MKLLRPLPVSANQVSVGSLLSGLAAGWCFSLGTLQGDREAALLYFACNVLDCADGQLARLRGTTSVFGYVLDGWIDHLCLLAVVIGLGHGLYARHAPVSAFWLLTAAAISIGWWSSVVEKIRHEWLRHVAPRARSWQAELSAMQELARQWRRAGTHRGERALVRIYTAYRTLWKRLGPQRPEACGELGSEPWLEMMRPVLRSAVATGPSFQITALVIAAAFGRVDLYLWFALVPGTLWGLCVCGAHGYRTRVLSRTGAQVA